ncbi:DNA polymerase kappa [Hondaea fermentalgiana]|uniref:DNA polymerase kappa n=1 Tax=Hondaea fermentalgiana TaxID=2315210 RepID=A0A2R5GA30_9STRA|nr:DNA polymerase kappa [Hondaea fermentalgiana]|eukprot:GBG27876.1 DNA polymerase kappa [Hondaea fermentalgiana]
MSTAAHGAGEPCGDGLRERETVRTGGRHGGESAASRATSASTKDEDAVEAPRNGSDFAHLFVFANEKAGMKKVDKEHVNQIVFEMSKGSEHFKEAQRRDERTQAEVRKLRAKLATTLESDLAPVRHRVDAKVTKLLRERDLSRIYCVVDMDCFFAAVEMRDDPSLAGKPMAVGGLSMISTTNYLAREYGVRSAMPGFIARKLCPELVFVKSNFDKYRQASQEVRDILKKYDPKLHAGSLDEAYMDITDFVDVKIATEQAGANLDADAQTARRFHVAERVVQAMRDEVSAHTRLTCSAGIARTRMLAKIASDRNKPNGQCVVPWQPEKMLRFTRELAIRKVPGIGKVAEKKLKDALGVATVRDLWDKRYLCAHLLSAVQADYLLRVTLCCTNPSVSSSQASSSSAASSSAAAVSALPSAFGQGEDNQRGRKSIGMERTFSQGASSVQELFDTCLDICARLSRRCVEKQLIGHCVTLKIKKSSFEVFTRQTIVTNAVPRCADGTDLFEHARELLAREMPCRLRLMGIKVSKLIDPSHAPVKIVSSGVLHAVKPWMMRRTLK